MLFRHPLHWIFVTCFSVSQFSSFLQIIIFSSWHCIIISIVAFYLFSQKSTLFLANVNHDGASYAIYDSLPLAHICPLIQILSSLLLVIHTIWAWNNYLSNHLAFWLVKMAVFSFLSSCHIEDSRVSFHIDKNCFKDKLADQGWASYEDQWHASTCQCSLQQ